MSKIRRGAKGRKKTKAIVTSVVAGGTALLVSLGVGIGALINQIKSNNNEFATLPEDITRPTYTETFSPKTENLETNQTVENIPSYETEEKVENPTHVTDETYYNSDTVSDPSYADLLANLTTASQEYCATNRTSLSKMEVIGLNSIKVEGDTVSLKGDFKNNTKFGNYILTLQNDQNPDLKIFNIEEDEIEVSDLCDAVNEVLYDKATKRKLDARQSIVDFSKIDTSLVADNIVEGLSNPAEVKNLQDNIDNTSFSLLLNDCVKNNGTYTYSYSTFAYTEDYVYWAISSFDVDSKLTGSALINKIQEHVVNSDTTCTTLTVSTNKFEKALHRLKNGKTINPANVETETVEELSRY